MQLDNQILTERLSAFGIDANTRHNLALLRRELAASIDEVIAGFYAHFNRIPSANIHFAGPMLTRLQQRQRAHWLEMFECRFDQHYVANAIRIGRAHFDHKVPPRLYLAGQSHFQCSLISLAASKFGTSRDLPVLLASITRIIALDTDLAFSAYTRAFWTAAPATSRRESNEVWV